MERLNSISHNKNLTDWEDKSTGGLRIYSLNCRSLGKHNKDIATDAFILNSDIILLQETWIEPGHPMQELQIPGYILHLNNQGRGKGLATFFKESIFSHQVDITHEHMQLSKFTSKEVDIISIYRSNQGSFEQLNKEIESMTAGGKTLIVAGDFNFCYLEKTMNLTKKYMIDNNFNQLIHEPTHIEGNALDHCYLRDRKKNLDATVKLDCKYYTDHKGLAVHLRRKARGRK